MSRRIPDIPTEDLGATDPGQAVTHSRLSGLVRLINDRLGRLDRNVSDVTTIINTNVTASAAASIPTVVILPGGGSIGEPVIFENALWTWTSLGWVQAPKWFYQDTHANRVSSYDPTVLVTGTLFYETDRQLLYVVQYDVPSTQNQWVYLAGVFAALFANRPSAGGLTGLDAGMEFFATDYGIYERWTGSAWLYTGGTVRGTSAILATLAGIPIGTPETGLIVEETTYYHRFRWTGTAWEFAPGDPGSGYFVFGPQPQGGLWYALDGSSHTIIKPDGTTTSRATPNWNGTVAAMLGGGTATTVTAATSPTWDPSAITDLEFSHDHAVVDTIQVVDLGGTPKNAVSVQSTTAGSAHNHSLSDANAIIKPPSVANGGLPAYFQMLGWMRG